MIALIQRVSRARVTIDNLVYSEIGPGILAFIGIEKLDTDTSTEKMLDKILAYRIFNDSEGKMNLSVKDVAGGLMLVSQFTLAADTNSGLRPGFSSAMNPASAKTIYSNLVETAKTKHELVQSGQFAADMQIELENDGPVTFILSG
ncbi:MAG: D-tyrosyl-tRNA(Tyr) deacylase [Gammaproteobacteria bacterium]|nr:D-tyrosyl-tRNA(Tyr) deacylase [Gammaproteobacteria bacterium]